MKVTGYRVVKERDYYVCQRYEQRLFRGRWVDATHLHFGTIEKAERWALNQQQEIDTGQRVVSIISDDEVIRIGDDS